MKEGVGGGGDFSLLGIFLGKWASIENFPKKETPPLKIECES